MSLGNEPVGLKLWSTRSATTPPIGLAKRRKNALSETLCLYTVCLQLLRPNGTHGRGK